jgi:hypothetical protein
MKLWHFAIASCALLTLSREPLADVIVVDDSGGADFTQIQPAIDAALDGDTILVKPGNYPSFTINAKALTVIGEAGALPSVNATVLIANVAEGQVVSLARLTVKGVSTGLAAQGAKALRVLNCAGPVRAVQCEFLGRNGQLVPMTPPGVGVHVDGAHDFAISGSTVKGGAGISDHGCLFDTTTAGLSGLWIEGEGSVAAYECIIDGGHGGNGGDTTGAGGAGILTTPSSAGALPFVFAGRSNIHGGGGGNTDCMYGCPSDGGPGFHLVDAAHPEPDAIGWALDLMIGGGAAGVIQSKTWVSCGPAFEGPAYSDLLPFQFQAASLGFSMPAIAREGDFVTVTFTGPPGAHVFVNDRLTTTFEAVASWRGVSLAQFPPDGAPMREIKWGVIPSSGELKRTYHVPQLPPGEEAQTRFLQAYRVGANGITLGSFRTLTILDSAF